VTKFNVNIMSNSSQQGTNLYIMIIINISDSKPFHKHDFPSDFSRVYVGNTGNRTGNITPLNKEQKELHILVLCSAKFFIQARLDQRRFYILAQEHKIVKYALKIY
jgi:hypothetical protein